MACSAATAQILIGTCLGRISGVNINSPGNPTARMNLDFMRLNISPVNERGLTKYRNYGLIE
jgi:hypothetical protein